MLLCTLAFTGMSLPPGQGLGTQILVKVSFGRNPQALLTDHVFLPQGECMHTCALPMLHQARSRHPQPLLSGRAIFGWRVQCMSASSSL
jgi:hypothetical protein